MGSIFKSVLILMSSAAVCLSGLGCAREGISASGQVLLGDENERAGMLNSAQVSSAKRAPYERGIVGLLRLNAAGESIGTCGAVLIRPDVILSAGHCLDPAVNVQLLKVYAIASTDLNIAKPTDASARLVVKMVFHPLYKSRAKVENGVTAKSYDHDMSIAFLDRPYDSNFPPQPIAEASEVFKIGQELTVYGFGRGIDYAGGRADPAEKYKGTLQRGSVTLSGELYFDRVISRPNSKNFLCDGDSGGPAFFIAKNSKAPPVVVAINSAQMGKPVLPGVPTLFCKNAPAIFQPVAPFRNWIDQVLKENGR